MDSDKTHPRNEGPKNERLSENSRVHDLVNSLNYTVVRDGTYHNFGKHSVKMPNSQLMVAEISVPLKNAESSITGTVPDLFKYFLKLIWLD